MVVVVGLELGSSLYAIWSFSLLSPALYFKKTVEKNTVLPKCSLACINSFNFLSEQRKHCQTKVLLCGYLFLVLCISPFFTKKAGPRLEGGWKSQVCWPRSSLREGGREPPGLHIKINHRKRHH